MAAFPSHLPHTWLHRQWAQLFSWARVLHVSTNVLFLSKLKCWGYAVQKVLAKSWGYGAIQLKRLGAIQPLGYPAQKVLQQAGAVFFSHALLSLLQPAIFLSFQALTSPRLLPLSNICFMCPARFLESSSPCGDTTWVTCLRAHEANFL